MRMKTYRQYIYDTTFEENYCNHIEFELSRLTHASMIIVVKYALYPDTKRIFSISSCNLLMKITVSGSFWV